MVAVSTVGAELLLLCAVAGSGAGAEWLLPLWAATVAGSGAPGEVAFFLSPGILVGFREMGQGTYSTK